MTFRKLISALTVSTMMFSAVVSVASAAVEFNYDEGYYITNVADVMGRTPYIETVVKQLTSEEVVALSGSVDGISNKKLKATAYGNTANWTVYQIDGTVKGVGPLGVGYDLNDNGAYIKLKAIDATLDFSALTALGAKATAWDAGVATAAETNTSTAWSLKNLDSKGGCFLQLLDAFPNEAETDENNLRDLEYKYTLYVVVPAGTSATLNFDTADASVQYNVYNADEGYTGDLMVNKIATRSSAVVLSEAPATVDVTSVTISGATAATVGDNVQLSATVAPDNATDKTVTWTKVSGNGAVSDSGVVTATAAGDVVVKATAGGVDSANYTVSFAAPAPTPVYTESSIDVNAPVNGTTGLTDLQGRDVTLTANYGIAKFSKAIDTVANNYFVVATDSNNVEKEFEVDFAANGVEISNASTTFFAIVKSADHIIKSIRLKEIAK